MESTFSYKRIMLKLSGEALKGERCHGYDPEALRNVTAVIRGVRDMGIEVAVVVGAGNLWRGSMGVGMDQVNADYMGMLATAMNAIAIRETLRQEHVRARAEPFAVEEVFGTRVHAVEDEVHLHIRRESRPVERARIAPFALLDPELAVDVGADHRVVDEPRPLQVEVHVAGDGGGDRAPFPLLLLVAEGERPFAIQADAFCGHGGGQRDGGSQNRFFAHILIIAYSCGRRNLL